MSPTGQTSPGGCLCNQCQAADCFVGWVERGTNRKKCIVLCCKLIDSCTTLNNV